MITHAYVRYVDDSTHAIVPISSIKDFHPSGPTDFSDKTKYYVRWHAGDSEFYRARILLLGVSEEDVTVKLKNGRLRVRKVIESSDYSEEDSLTTEKENVKAQKKHMKERQATSTKADLMRILELKKKQATAKKPEAKGDLEELQAKYDRAQRHITRLERELSQVRQLNINLQEIVIKKVQSLKDEEKKCQCQKNERAAFGFDAATGPALVGALPAPAVRAPALPAACARVLAAPVPMALAAPVPAALAAPVHAALAAPVPAALAAPVPAALAAPVPAALAAPAPAALAAAPELAALPIADRAERDARLAENDGHMVDIGNGVLVDQASLLLAQGKRDALFVKDLAVAVFGSRLLMDSSVLGRHCPKKPGQERKPALCPTKLSVLKNVYVARLVNKGMPERFAKAGAKDVTRFINEKITELRRLDSRRKAAQEKFDLEGGVEPEGNA
ncbi:uncharacterized protein LOC115327774 [Ixodes scapularis]|uniref:uncharacterized protein LOC115327774 n=1 Tax=Ixodes scapularis TaxID=6945 RepID=UPI001A9EDD19|nr:uncharacterized protein LOC115327774 [Ixodes scapularis]